MGPKKAPVVKLPPILPKGHVIFDKSKKKQWILVKQIGTGGFGRIYESHCADSSEVAVVKMEHLESGPLFCEQNFAVRCLKKEMLAAWVKQRRLDHIPLPEFYSFGVTDDGMFRYVVMQRLGRNLEEVLTTFEWRLPDVLTFQIALEMLNALEFIHFHGYVHADIKGSNILFGYGNAETKSIYLCDFGLAAKTPTVYKEDKKLKHNGTIEYTSREAHRGAAPSRRGDLEILAYCLLHWMNGSLPWRSVLTNPEAVSTAKHAFFDKLPKSLSDCFGECPSEIAEYFSVVSRLPYETAPDYNSLRKIFLNGLQKRRANATQPFCLEKKSDKVKSITSPRTRSRAEPASAAAATPSTPTAPVPQEAKKSKFIVSHGPLAVAMARSRTQNSDSSSLQDSSSSHRKDDASSIKKTAIDLKRKHASPAKVQPVKPKTPTSGKPCASRNRDPYDYDESEDEDPSILYKTAFPDPMSSSSEEEEEPPPPKPVTRGRRVAARK